MKRIKRALRTVVIPVAAAAVGIGLLSGCSGSNWTPTNLSQPGVVENMPCDQLKDASDAKSRAVNQQDADAKATLGLKDDATVRDVERRLADRQKACEKGVTATSTTSATPTTAPPKQHETIEVANAAGVRESVPLSENVQVTGGDTRDNPNLPALNKLLPDCGVWQDWDDVRQCVEKHHAQWYKDAVNRLHDQGKLYYSWSDVEQWAGVRTPSGAFPESRVIEVHGWTEAEKSPTAARAEVAGLIGKETADKLDVIYIPVGFMNTWRTNDVPPAVTDFADYNRQVRVNIVPLKLEGGGWKQVRHVGGVFDDCYNMNGFYPVMPAAPHAPLLCPAGTILAGQPVPMGGCNPQGGGKPECQQGCGGTTPPPPPPCTTCTTTPPPPPPSCPPDKPYGQWPVCKDAPTRAPNFPDSSGQNDTPGPGGYTPPAQMPQPPATQQAPPPAPAPAPVPDSHPAPSSAPLPPATGAPAPSAPATGTACAPGETSC